MANNVRAGNATAFWNAATTGAGGTSAVVELSRNTSHFVFYVTVSGATTISLECAPSTTNSAEGVWAETGTSFATFVDGQSLLPVQYVFSGAGTVCIRVSDFVPRVVRLKSTNSVTATAGYETLSA